MLNQTLSAKPGSTKHQHSLSPHASLSSLHPSDMLLQGAEAKTEKPWASEPALRNAAGRKSVSRAKKVRGWADCRVVVVPLISHLKTNTEKG